jgi:hypothetical protein
VRSLCDRKIGIRPDLESISRRGSQHLDRELRREEVVSESLLQSAGHAVERVRPDEGERGGARVAYRVFEGEE